MPTIWDTAFATAGADFEAYTPDLQAVTVAQIDPDTDANTTAAGATLGSATGVPALKRTRRRQPLGVGGGELGADESRFVFSAARVTWTVKARDQVTDGAGIVWVIEKVELLVFGAIVACDVAIKR